jgi:hypothetical protein
MGKVSYVKEIKNKIIVHPKVTADHESRMCFQRSITAGRGIGITLKRHTKGF